VIPVKNCNQLSNDRQLSAIKTKDKIKIHQTSNRPCGAVSPRSRSTLSIHQPTDLRAFALAKSEIFCWLINWIQIFICSQIIILSVSQPTDNQIIIMKLSLIALLTGYASAFAPSPMGKASTALFERVDSSAAVQAALEASKKYGPTSKEAAVAWDIVEELDASDNR
jgi:hypothetical protein